MRDKTERKIALQTTRFFSEGAKIDNTIIYRVRVTLIERENPISKPTSSILKASKLRQYRIYLTYRLGHAFIQTAFLMRPIPMGKKTDDG